MATFMAGINELAAGIETVDQILVEAILEPDAERTDWQASRARITFVRNTLDRDVLECLDDALFAADDDLAPRIKRRVAALVAEVAAVYAASGDMDAARGLLEKAITIAGAGEQSREFEAGKEEPSTFAKLVHARWLLGQGEFKRADAVLAKARRQAKNRDLRDAIREAERGPRPLEKAPALFRLNGIGVGLYGERERRPDGSYIATHCISFLWIPILPLGAYRVQRVDSNAYQFYAKESLGPIARAWRALVLVGALAVGGHAGVTNYLDSPSRKASIAMTEARDAEKAGDRERALDRYRFALSTYPQEIDPNEAAASIVRISAENDVKEPATPASIEAIGRVVNAFYELPANVREGKTAGLLADKLVSYADQIGTDTPEKSTAVLTVLDMAARATEGRSEGKAITERRAKLRKSIADVMATERPLGALRHYVALGDDDSITVAGKIIDSFGAAPSLWVEAEGEVTKWAALAEKQGVATARSAKTRLDDAKKKLTDDQPLFETGDEKALRKAFADVPGYQEVALGIAMALRGRGEAKAALETIAALGPPGRLTATAQRALADMRAEAGDLVAADAILTALVTERLPAFQEAQRAYHAAATKFEEQFDADLQAGSIPRDLERKLQNADKTEQKNLLRTYFEDKFRGDPRLNALKDEFQRYGAVVPASISLGMVKLRRAAAEKGDAQRVLLEQAERAFLALQGEAAGDPRYHLGLGQVYHRLGRTADGDAEFDGLLAKNDTDLSLSVANAYRELGLEPRARKVAESVYNDSSVEQAKRYAAASLRANMVMGLEDREKWLGLCDQSLPYVQAQLRSVKGTRALLLGNWSEAEKAFASEGEYYEKDASHTSVSANNLALTYSHRYQASGDIAHLRSAVKWLDTAIRLEGDNVIALANTADLLAYQAAVTVVDRWVDTRVLRLDSQDARLLVTVLLDGPLHAEVLAAMGKNPNQQRMLEISRREQVLAPQRTSAYRREVDWFVEREDGKALGELRARLEAMPPFSAQNTSDARAAWVQGELDAEFLATAKQEATRWRNNISALEKTARPATIGAAWLMLGEQLRRQLLLDVSPEIIDEMVKAHRRARELWLEGISDSGLSGALFVAALSKARAASPTLAKAWDTDRRNYSYTRLAYRAAHGPNGEEVLAALRKQPEMAEAASLRRGHVENLPSLSDWIIAHLAGNSELEKASEKAFDSEIVRHSAEIEARIFPGQVEEALDLALVRTRGKSDHL